MKKWGHLWDSRCRKEGRCLVTTDRLQGTGKAPGRAFTSALLLSCIPAMN